MRRPIVVALLLLPAFVASCRDVLGLGDYTFDHEVCVPGAPPEPCYDGPAGTAGVGRCRPGPRACNADGTGYEACTQIVPTSVESCAPVDEPNADTNCDGEVEICTHAVEWVRFVDGAVPIGIGIDEAATAPSPVLVSGSYPGSHSMIAGFPVAPPSYRAAYGGMTLVAGPNGDLAGVWSSAGSFGPASEIMTDAVSAGGTTWAVGLHQVEEPTAAYASGNLAFHRFAGSQEPFRADAYTGMFYRPVLAARAHSGGATLWMGATFNGAIDPDGEGPLAQLQGSGGDDVFVARLTTDGVPVQYVPIGGAGHDVLRTVAVGRQTTDVLVAGCYEGTVATACGNLPAGPGYFVVRLDEDAGCRSVHAVPIGNFDPTSACRPSATFIEVDGTGAIPVVAYVPTTEAKVVVAECTTPTCVPVVQLDLQDSAVNAADRAAELVHAGADAAGNVVVVFSFRGLLTAQTAVGDVAETRTQYDVAVMKVARNADGSAWAIQWIETLSQGQPDVRFEQPNGARGAVTTPDGSTYVTGLGQGNIGAVSPQPIPSQNKMFVARVSP